MTTSRGMLRLEVSEVGEYDEFLKGEGTFGEILLFRIIAPHFDPLSATAITIALPENR